MPALSNDIRYALRNMRKNIGFTAVAITALALGIGATTAIFSLARTVVFKPLPYPNADRLVQIRTVSPKNDESQNWVQYRDVLDWNQRNRTFDTIAGYGFALLNLPSANEPVALYGARISYNLFPALGLQPMMGRNFLQSEDRPGHAQQMLLSHDLWVNRFGSDPQIVGRTVRFIGRPESDLYTVIGVMPPGFNFPLSIPTSVTPPSRQMAYWIPLGVEPTRAGKNFVAVISIGLLRPAVSAAAAQADLDSIAAQLAHDFPETNLGLEVKLMPLNDSLLGQTKPALLLLLGAISVVVLITCANIANLLLSRALGRSREIGIRLALGASRSRLVQQSLTESLLLSTSGGLLGLLAAPAMLSLLLHLAPQNIPRLAGTHIDVAVLLFAAGLSIATGLLFGNLPAFTAANTNVNRALTGAGTRTTAEPGRVKTRDLLVIAEVALAVLLTIGAGLLLKSFLRLTNVDAGFSRDRVLASIVILIGPKFPDLDSRIRFTKKVLDNLESAPGIVSAGATDAIPLTGNTALAFVQVEGKPSHEQGANRSNVAVFSASPRYLQTMGIRLLRGRYLTPQDAASGAFVTVINRAAAARFWPSEAAIGKRISFNNDPKGNPIQQRVIGIVADTREFSIDKAASPAVYVPMQHALSPPQMLSVRTDGNTSAAAAGIRRAVAAVDKDQPVFLVTTMEDLYNNSVADRRFATFILTLLGLLATALAALGVYGVISYSATQRIREFGIRAALGAQRIHILQLVLSRGVLLTGVGIGIGTLTGLALTRFLKSLLYEVTPTDPWTIAAVALLLTTVALIAGYIPSRRAMKLDPLTALRHD